MAVPIVSIKSVSVVLILATALSCQDPTSSNLLTDLNLRLTSRLGEKRDFFEGEPVYIVFSLSNHGSDTAWVMPFNFHAWSLDGDLRDSLGNELSKWGFIVDYFYGPGYRGESLAPGKSLYQVPLIQDRWGVYSPEMRNLYFSHHLPVGRYTLRMRFYSNLPGHRLTSRVFDSEPITFRVHPRTAAEEQSFQAVQDLRAMPWDTAQRPAYLDSLMSSVRSRAAEDPFLPLLGVFFGAASAFGSLPDSAMIDELALKAAAAARAQRATAGGVIAMFTVRYYRPAAFQALTQELAGSLAGEVAASVLER